MFTHKSKMKRMSIINKTLNIKPFLLYKSTNRKWRHRDLLNNLNLKMVGKRGIVVGEGRGILLEKI